MLHNVDKMNPNLRRKFLKPFIVNMNPNTITLLALLSAIVAGASFYYDFLILAIIFVLVNAFLDILDGEIARVHKRATKLGDFLDHTADRIADVAILLGLTLSSYVPDIYGYLTIIVMLLVSYLGTQAQALSKKRVYGGLIGRSDRLVLITIFAILNIFYMNMLYYGIMIILILSVITFIQRFMRILDILK